MRRTAVASALFSLVLLCGSLYLPASGASSGQSPVSSTFFRITVNSSVTKLPVPVPFGTMCKTAAGSTTAGTSWAALEPSNGTFNWTPMDNLIAAAKAAGVVDVMYTFFETPQWASSNATQSCSSTAGAGVYGCAAPPKNIGDWDAFVTALVTRYKGEIQYYELWNEPNISTEFSGTVQQMVTMAQSAYPIIKSIDPAATVLAPGVAVGGIEPYSPGCSPSECWLAEYLQDGGGQYADGIAFHGKTCLSDESLCTQEGIACSSSQIEACAGSSLMAQVNGIRAIMASYGLSGKPLVDTEGGYSDEVGQDDLWGSVDQQVAFVSRFFIVQASQNLTVAVYFSWLTNPSTDLMGFGTTNAETATDQAYTQTHDWLLGSTFAGPCSLSNGVWTCGLTSPQGYQEMLVWADTNSSASSYSPSGQFTEYQDLTGAVYPISAGSSVPINEKPLLLESTATSASSSSSTSSTTTSSKSSSTSTVPELPAAMLVPTMLACLALASLLARRSLARGRP